MHRLDPKTLHRLASVVCDVDGAEERRGSGLEQLLREAGWTDPPEYDGSGRVAWLREALLDRPAADVERLVCRVCDPLEYDGGMPVAETFRNAVNSVLEPERLVVTFVGARPVVGEAGGAFGGTPVFGAPDDLDARLRRLIGDPEVIEILVDRAEQSRLAQAAGAHLLALFGIGSLVEGLVLAVLLERLPHLEKQGFAGRKGTVPADRAGLDLLLETAHAHKLIELDAKDFMDPVRNFRNYIHPRRQAAQSFRPDHDTVALCWGPVHAVLNDLERP